MKGWRRAEQYGALIEHCIKCSACQAVCPVAGYADDFPGPKQAGPDLLRLLKPGKTRFSCLNPAAEAGAGLAKLKYACLSLVRRLKSDAAAAEETPALDWCTGCMRCELVCPHGVPVARLIREARGTPAGRMRCFRLNTWRDLLLGYPHLWGMPGTALSRLVNGFLSSGLGKLVCTKFLGLAPGSPLPRYARQSFFHYCRQCDQAHESTVLKGFGTVGVPRPVRRRERQPEHFSAPDSGNQAGESAVSKRLGPDGASQILRSREREGAPRLSQQLRDYSGDYRNRLRGGMKVVYFPGCYTNFNEPEIGKALITLLDLLGIDPVVPRAACCGVPLLAGGFRERAHRLFERNIRQLLPYVRDGYLVVCTCPTCGLALKKIYVEELGTEDAERLAAVACDYTEILEPLAGELAELLRPGPVSLAYHQPCHALAQGTGDLGPALLRMIPGAEVKIVEGCCGQAGTFGFKKEKSRVAAVIGRPLIDQLAALAPDLIVTPCGSCKHKITAASGQKVYHPLVLLIPRQQSGIQGILFF